MRNERPSEYQSLSPGPRDSEAPASAEAPPDSLPGGGPGRPGHFKIFLGMAPGVGKTYAMLSEARRLRDQGSDVVLGWLEAHERPETLTLAEGIETIPPLEVDYRGHRLKEMDVASLLRRAPALAVVDELAHSNAPGSLHPKRFQDILELLENGIDVFTTVNIQHLESLGDIVESLVKAPVRERIPDSVFDRADEIQLVDLPPEDLLQRLAEGRVYTAPISRQAREGFFKKENLAALREMALRQAARIAGEAARSLLTQESRLLVAAQGQRILVAISPSPHSEYLIRFARRTARSLQAAWTALYVETGRSLDDTDSERIVRYQIMARNLGAEVDSLADTDVASGILRYARSHDVSIILLGKSGLSSGRSPFGRKTIGEKLLEGSGPITIMAVQERPLAPGPGARKNDRDPDVGRDYLVAGLIVLLTTLANLGIASVAGYWTASFVYMAAISLSGLFLSRGPILAAAVLSGLLWNFLFIPPRYTFFIARMEDVLMLVLYLVLALSSGFVTSKLRANQRMLKLREERMEVLQELSSKLAASLHIDAIRENASDFLRRALGLESFLILGDSRTFDRGDYPEAGNPDFGEREKAAARYCFEKAQASGRNTSTLASSPYHFLPLASVRGSLGVVALRLPERYVFGKDRANFAATIIRTLGLAVERALLAEGEKKTEVLKESERLGSLLLHSVSHELRSPLTAILGSATALDDPEVAKDSGSVRELSETILESSLKLNRVVENLLSMNRLEAGHLKLSKTSAEPGDLVSSAVGQFKSAIEAEKRILSLDLPGEAGQVFCDEALIVQVLANLLQNALIHTPPGTSLGLGVKAEGGAGTLFFVQDEGPGVDDDEIGAIFDKFRRGRGAASGGTGLGLALCKGIVEAHGGIIGAQPLRPSGSGNRGFRVWFRLPPGVDAVRGPGGVS